MNVLVVVDMQKDFITGPLGNEECRAVVPKVCEIMRNPDYDLVIFTKDTHSGDYLNTQEGRNLPVEHCIKGTDGFEIVSEIAEIAEDLKNYEVIEKVTFGSTLFGKRVEELSKENAELNIDFVGVCTGICVISNAMIAKAAAPEAKLKVYAQACACVTKQTHETALEAMKLCQIEIA